MTPPDSGTTYEEFVKVANEFRAMTEDQGSDANRVLTARIGQVLAQVGQMLMEVRAKTEQISARSDEIAMRERTRDRGPIGVRDDRAIRSLAALSAEDRERFVRAVEAGPPNATIQEFANQIAQKLNRFAGEFVDILQCLGSWFSFMTGREADTEAEQIARIITDPTFAEPDTQAVLYAAEASNPASVFSQHLRRLLHCHDTLGVTAKAEALLRRNERQYTNGRLSTDIRPIFSYKVDEPPAYALVIHDLVLAVNDGGTIKSFGISLTSTDILELAGVLNRAWQKEQTLRQRSPYKLLPLSNSNG